jgi:dipeptidyl aminopeptidase/acylaminoacyl peptidase
MRRILFLLAGVAAVVVSAAPAPAAEAGLPANGRIVFATVDGMASMNPDGSGQWGLRFTAIGQAAPDWAPDGASIALTGPDATGQSIYTMSPDGTDLRRVITRPYLANPSWSPDGKQFAFDDGAQVSVAEADGTNARELVSGVSPSWSPDGKHIAYVSFGADGTSDVSVLELASGRSTLLTDGPGLDIQPDWSPRGDKIVFVSDRDGYWSVFTMKPDGSAQTALTDDAYDFEPAWSPDGTQIAFVRSSQIWVMTSDGKNAHQLTYGNVWSGSPSWQPLAAAPQGCTLWGTPASDLLVGTSRNDVICGLEGEDSVIGLEGHDVLRGDGGADWVAGGTGFDVIRGGPGDDLLDARDGDWDSVLGGLGFDTARVDRGPLDNGRNRAEVVLASRNAAAWRPTTASRQEPTNPSVLAVNGRLDDYWSSGSYPPQWIEVDLGSPTRVASLRLIAPDLPTGASVLVLGRGPEGDAYRLLHEFHGPTVFKQALGYTPKQAWRRIRYVRIQIPIANVFIGWIALPELEVYTPKS